MVRLAGLGVGEREREDRAVGAGRIAGVVKHEGARESGVRSSSRIDRFIHRNEAEAVSDALTFTLSPRCLA